VRANGKSQFKWTEDNPLVTIHPAFLRGARGDLLGFKLNKVEFLDILLEMTTEVVITLNPAIHLDKFLART
jgi:hypothetical protein